MALHHAPSPAVRPAAVTDPTPLEPRSVPSYDWRRELPVLKGLRMTLRGLRPQDAPTLFTILSCEETSRFVSAPPSTVEGVERFIAWTADERQAGTHVCFGIVPQGMSDAVGIIQVRGTDANFGTAEWGFALGSAYWGTGIFREAAQLVIAFAFDVLRVHRLEARAAVMNVRGNAALRKLGAVQEGVLRGSFFRRGEYLDQALWTILATDRPGWQRISSAVH